MKKSFTELDPTTIDEYIEQTGQQFPHLSGSEDARYLRELHYLHRKEEILQRARLRLQFTSVADEKMARIGRPGETGTVRSEQNIMVAQPYKPERRLGFTWSKLAAVLAAALLLLGALFGTSQFFLSRSQQTPGHQGSTTAAPTTATVTATHTVLFSDPLSQNIHNWPIDHQHFFKNGAYHLSVLTSTTPSSAILPDVTQTVPWSYSLTMTQTQGDLTSPMNAFGVIFVDVQTKKNGYSTESFYTLEFVGKGELALFHYDNTQNYPWTMLWTTKLAAAPILGQANTLKVTATTTTLTIALNGTVVGHVANLKLRSGQFGMVVNLKGSDVAFQNMLITRP